MPDLRIALGIGMTVELFQVDYVLTVKDPEMGCQIELPGDLAEEWLGLSKKFQIVDMCTRDLYDLEADSIFAVIIFATKDLSSMALSIL